MLEIPGRARPYLRRAYSVADADAGNGEIELLVKTIGPGTAALEELAPQAPVGLLGPLGNGFTIGDLPSDRPVAVVAGGIGAAPFPLLFRGLAARGVAGDFFLGGRTAADLAFLPRFSAAVSGRTHLTTDDASLGKPGFVTAAFAAAARKVSYARVFACGPMPMLAALARSTAELRLPTELSTEAEMGCGFGACLGCVIPGREKAFIISCTEGPILPPEKIAWDRACPARLHR